MPALLSLFCPLCQSFYNDTNKRPRLGTCHHNVCSACIKTKGDAECPICDKENAFTDVVYNHGLENFLVAVHSENNDLVNELCSNEEELSTGSCKAGKDECTETIRLCVTCAENSKLLKKLPNGNFEIIVPDKLIYLAKAIFYCSGCIADGLPDHLNHVFLRLSEINLVDRNLDLWYSSAILSVVQGKLTELSEKSAITGSEWMNNIVVKFKREALNFEAVTKPDRFGWTLEQFRFTQQKAVDIHSIPKLDQAKQKSVEMARKVIDRIEKVLERYLWIRKEELNQLVSDFPVSEGVGEVFFNKFCRYLQETSPALLPYFISNYKEQKVFEKEITALSKKFNSLKITDLTESEAAYIDQEVDRKMTEAVQKLGLPEDEALCNILQDAFDHMHKILEQTSEEIARFEDYFANRMEELEDIINKESEEAMFISGLFLIEVTEKSFVVDRLLLKYLEAIHEQCEIQLLWLRYSPETYEHLSDEFFNTYLLYKEFGNKVQTKTKPVLSRSLSA